MTQLVDIVKPKHVIKGNGRKVTIDPYLLFDGVFTLNEREQIRTWCGRLSSMRKSAIENGRMIVDDALMMMLATSKITDIIRNEPNNQTHGNSVRKFDERRQSEGERRLQNLLASIKPV